MKNPLNLVVAIFLCFTFLLIESLPVQASASNQAELIRQVKLLKKSKLAGGYKASEVVTVRLLGNEMPETFTIYERGVGLKDVVYRAQTYQKKAKQWKTIYKRFSYDQQGLSFVFDKGKLLDNELEHLVVGPAFGSGGIIIPEVVGSLDGKHVKRLLAPNKSYAFGQVVIKNNTLYAGTASIVYDTYRFEDKRWKHRIGNGQDDRDLAGKVTKLLKLNRTGKQGYFSTSRHVSLKKGDTFAIVRENPKDESQHLYRTLRSGPSKIDWNGYHHIALKAGNETWDFQEYNYGLQTKLYFKIR
ncbi:hypothetical protein [Exiguobacterium sp. s144]|uniref:hypothetical protein n=1 Tax=Exiguobacterium sp. s144 TaxID=2751195 RepID=UPI001BE6698D|nr:hypothetical protein [Exiguobacterium sp. s144]